MLDLWKLRRRKLKALIRQADIARDGGNHSEAATLYLQATRLAKGRPDLYVQLGNMLKDTGRLNDAVEAYASAHNGFVALAGRRGLGWARENISDVYLQLGHLFKKAGQRSYALSFYRKSNSLKPIPAVAEELKVAALTTHGVAENPMGLAYPDLQQLPEGLDAGEAISVIEQAVASEGNQCVCWSTRYVLEANQFQAPDKMLTCQDCGSVYARSAMAMNIQRYLLRIPEASVTSKEVMSLVNHWKGSETYERIGLIGAIVDDDNNSQIESIGAFSSCLQPGIARCSFDVVVLWNVSYDISDIRRIVDQAFQALRPNGLLIVGYTPTSALPIYSQKLRQSVGTRRLEGQSNALEGDGATGAVVNGPLRETKGGVSPLFFLSDVALRSLIDPMRREVRILPDRTNLSVKHRFMGVRKSGTLSVGIMSGIGDAVWSFVIERAVRRKYKADALHYYVHDSGDARRKRSNNMLARFSFVNDLSSSIFQVHADTPMDDRTGHLNYISSGPTLIDGKDEFDYRLIVNSHLEHGAGFDIICEDLALSVGDLDYDFFKHYQELTSDIAAVDKITRYVGKDYAIFYYGAEVDNTIGGLNRDEIWTPEDWNRLGRLINDEYGLKLVVIGAPYDTSYANKIQGRNRDDFYYNAIGELDITETLSLIQRSKFIVAFPAGVGIVGPYMRIPTVIFWRPKHLSYHVMHDRAGFNPKFAENWVPPQVIKAGGYYPAWYGIDTPESVMGVIRDRGWATRDVFTPIGSWEN